MKYRQIIRSGIFPAKNEQVTAARKKKSDCIGAGTFLHLQFTFFMRQGNLHCARAALIIRRQAITHYLMKFRSLSAVGKGLNVDKNSFPGPFRGNKTESLFIIPRG